MKRALLMLLAGLMPAWLTGSAPAEEARAPARPAAVRVIRYWLAPFGEVAAYRPAGSPRGVVLLLSDRNGWTRPMDEMARALAQRDLLVGGISTPALMQAMESTKARCINPNYPLVDLTRDLQHRMAMTAYRKPVLLGVGTGATMTYAAIAQWPGAAYQAALSIDPATPLAGRKPWCAAPGFATHRVSRPRPGWRFGANPRIGVRWTVIARNAALLHFVERVPHASLVVAPERAAADQLQARVTSAVLSQLPPPAPVAAIGEAPIPDMPLTIISAAPGTRSDMMAIAYSGDGGWVGIDQGITGQIAAAGIPVVGVDSLSYFWSARTPRGAGHDLDQLIRAFGQRWGRRKVVLIGYSFGADAMPYMIDNLDPDLRARIASVSLLGLSDTAQFQFHVTSWLDMDSGDALPTMPAIARLKGLAVRCVAGALEKDSACPAIPGGLAQYYVVPGGHHFDRNAPLLARIILGQRRPGRVAR